MCVFGVRSKLEMFSYKTRQKYTSTNSNKHDTLMNVSLTILLGGKIGKIVHCPGTGRRT